MTLTRPISLDPNSAPDETLHVTASGLPVRIYATDGGGEYPVHGAIYNDDGEWLATVWTAAGFFFGQTDTCEYDLRDRPKAKRGWWVGIRDVEGDGSRVSFYPNEAAVRNDTQVHSFAYIKKGDGLDTPADPPLWVDWSRLPDWAKWAAADNRGFVHYFEERPSRERETWMTGAKSRLLPAHLSRLAPGFDWRKALTQRPEGV